MVAHLYLEQLGCCHFGLALGPVAVQGFGRRKLLQGVLHALDRLRADVQLHDGERLHRGTGLGACQDTERVSKQRQTGIRSQAGR